MQMPKQAGPEKSEKRHFLEESMVELYSTEGIDVCMRYPGMALQHAEKRCLMREEVAERLLMAQNFLPEGVRLRIWDAWRPLLLQRELYERYSEIIVRMHSLDRVSEEERRTVITSFISFPREDREFPPVHTTGGAVDVTLVDTQGRELLMGTEFDSFSEKTYTAYFENTGEKEIKKNRRMLYYAMTKAGFTNLPSEWWHYDYGDGFWAYYTKKPARYKGIFTLEEITKYGENKQKK